MCRPRIKTAEVNGKRVIVMDKVFDNGLWRETVHNVCRVATSGMPESIERYVKSKRYAKLPLVRANIRREREISELRMSM